MTVADKISCLLLGRPARRYWHVWSRNGGLGGSSLTLYLCAAIGETISEKDLFPGPAALGPVLAVIRVGFHNDEGLRGFDISGDPSAQDMALLQNSEETAWLYDLYQDKA